MVSVALLELLVELSVLAEAEVSELLGPPAEVGVTGELSMGEFGEFGSCSLVFFFFKNPRVGMGASVT